MMILHRVTSPNNGKKMKKKMNNIYFYVLSLRRWRKCYSGFTCLCLWFVYIVEIQKRHSLLFDMENDEKLPVRYSLSQKMKEEIHALKECKYL